MTDVVKIAMDCRASLAAEVARLDKFIRMAEVLIKYDQGQHGNVTEGADAAASGEAVTDSGSKATAIGEASKTSGAVALAATRPRHAVTFENGVSHVLFQPDPAPEKARARSTGQTRPDDLSPANTEHFLFNDKPSTDEAVLLLSNPLPNEDAPIGDHTGDPVDVHLDVHIGQKLRQRRWMMGMSGERLGEIIGVGLDQIKAYESGSVHIGASRMWEIAVAMEVPMSYFFEDIDGQAPDTGEARGEVLTDKEALTLVHNAPHTRTAQAS